MMFRVYEPSHATCGVNVKKDVMERPGLKIAVENEEIPSKGGHLQLNPATPSPSS